MNRFILISGTILLLSSCKKIPVNTEAYYIAKADSILALMSLEEKIGQTNLLTSDWDVTGPSIRNDYIQLIQEGKVGAIFNAYTVDYITKLQREAVEKGRLHIPLLFGYDDIHGHRTIFPIPLGQASSWDLAAIETSDSISAAEATAEGLNLAFAPMTDISDDPRWGRVAEGPGEDTWLACQIVKSRVRGFQGSDFLQPQKMAACVKHFAAYGAAMAGRDYNTVDLSEICLFEKYFPPYKAGIDQGACAVMVSFNDINGMPSTCNEWLIRDILKNKWHFKGIVMSDYDGVKQLINHGVAADSASAAKLALNAGVDMDMQSSCFINFTDKLITQNRLNVKILDDAVRRILIIKMKLGLFSNPYKFCNKIREKQEIMKPAYLSFARKFAANSCVLLKNTDHILPMKKTLNTIAVIGPLSDSMEDMLGNWSAAGENQKCVTLVQGIQNKFGKKTKVLVARGCNFNDDSKEGFAEAISVASKADMVVMALGERRDMSGEAASRTNIDLPGVQLLLAREIIKANKNCVVVLFNGRPLTITGLDSIAPAILEAWFGGTEAGNAIADVLCGDINPGGKLTMTFPRTTGQIPVFYNHRSTGRPVDPWNPGFKYSSRYIDCPNTPLYPFGYGLSYTTFTYSNIHLNKTHFSERDSIIATIDVTNTGDYDGSEIVELYTHQLVGEITRPVKELKGFHKINVPKGEKRTLSFILKIPDLSYFHKNMKYTWDTGEYELILGNSSADDNHKLNFYVTGY